MSTAAGGTRSASSTSTTPDAINAADGTFAPSDPNHATFTSDGGFSVNVVRRVGEKYLPGCM